MEINNKKALREAILALRKNQPKEDKFKSDKKIISTLTDLEIYKKAKTIFVYVSVNEEVNTRRFIEEALGLGKIIAVPKTYKGSKEMKAVIINSLEDLGPARFNLLEPKDDSKILEKEEIDLIVVPGAVFDFNLNRIGYGGGYYDRFLKDIEFKNNKVALAYDFQVLDKIEVESHDMKMDLVITEKRILTNKDRY